MRIIEQLEPLHKTDDPVVLTIGNFDGMHRGHQALLQLAQSLTKPDGQLVVITFRNHPSEVLKPEQPLPLLCGLAHKLHLLEQTHMIDILFLLLFTRTFSQHSAAAFIEQVRQYVRFSHLVLGHDATLGRDRQGNRSVMHALGEEWGFTVHYLEEYRFEGKPISSSHIRTSLQQGHLEEVEQFLNRPYSIYGQVLPGQGKGRQIGWPTLNLAVEGLCLPPFGVYAVNILHNKDRMRGIANLGIAPTVRNDSTPFLEVYLFDVNKDFYGEAVEVIFKYFIRPEKKFQNMDELRRQIRQDIDQVLFE